MNSPIRARVPAALWICSLAMAAASATAQDYYHPLNHRMPPGMAAGMLNAVRGYDPAWLQPIRVELPSDGTVAVYSASIEPAGIVRTPAQFSINAGHVYRLKLADLPEFPNAEIYPSIELLDHLHPPAGMAHDFPVPVVFAAEDLKLALAGKLVTRVIYLEQPSMAQLLDPLRREIPQSVAPAENALKEADRLGRPIAIVRIGGRQPSALDNPQFFFGTGGAIDMSTPETSGEGFVRLNTSNSGKPQLADLR